MKWKRLIYCKDKFIFTGAIFRFPIHDKLIYEAPFKLILCNTYEEGCCLKFYSLKGSNRGLAVGIPIPEGHAGNSSKDFIDASWLQGNWNNFVSPDFDVKLVFYSSGQKNTNFPPL
jgi:hypothetical protein